MKRRLIEMRHAKSSWANSGMTDHERPLNDRGRRDAVRMGERLTKIGWCPDLVLSSDSNRTRETFSLMSDSFKGVECQFRSDLYHAGVREVVSFVREIPSGPSTIMLLGHNPGWEHVVQHLSGEEVTMKTATAALLEIEADDWNEAIRMAGGWKLLDVIYPRELD
jgi:phosphohistidine phosphatase